MTTRITRSRLYGNTLDYFGDVQIYNNSEYPSDIINICPVTYPPLFKSMTHYDAGVFGFNENYNVFDISEDHVSFDEGAPTFRAGSLSTLSRVYARTGWIDLDTEIADGIPSYRKVHALVDNGKVISMDYAINEVEPTTGDATPIRNISYAPTFLQHQFESVLYHKYNNKEYLFWFYVTGTAYDYHFAIYNYTDDVFTTVALPEVFEYVELYADYPFVLGQRFKFFGTGRYMGWSIVDPNDILMVYCYDIVTGTVVRAHRTLYYLSTHIVKMAVDRSDDTVYFIARFDSPIRHEVIRYNCSSNTFTTIFTTETQNPITEVPTGIVEFNDKVVFLTISPNLIYPTLIRFYQVVNKVVTYTGSLDISGAGYTYADMTTGTNYEYGIPVWRGDDLGNRVWFTNKYNKSLMGVNIVTGAITTIPNAIPSDINFLNVMHDGHILYENNKFIIVTRPGTGYYRIKVIYWD